MAERIEIPGDPSGVNYDEQEKAEDIRYIGLTAKKRLHPRLLISPFLDSSSVTAEAEINNFILETASESVEEKYQVVQTFGPDFIFFYGSKPRIFTYTGKLFNTEDKPWKEDWQKAWDRQFPTNTGTEQLSSISGTNLILNGAIARLEYDGLSRNVISGSANGIAVQVREGYLTSLEIQTDSRNQNVCNFRFSMFITNAFTEE